MTDTAWQGAVPNIAGSPERASASSNPVERPDPHGGTDAVVRGCFTGSAERFFRLLVKGTLLQIPTLGFYRFWLVTDIRRHLWSNTRIGADAFEYTGTAKELLIGFLIAVAVLTPIYVLYFLVGLEAERLQAFASIPLFLVLYVLGQYATYRARRYRATRTVFRGVRFWMTGSGWAYAGRAFVWDLLTALTLGLVYPWRTAALERYKMANTRFGDLPGSFSGTGWTFFRRGWWLWAVGVLLLAALAAVPLATVPLFSDDPARMGAAMVLPAVLLLVWVLVAFPLFRAIETKWRVENLRFGDVSVASDLRKGTVFGCYLGTFVVGLLYSLVAGAFLGLTVGTVFQSGLIPQGGSPTTLQMVPLVAGMVLLYLVFLLGFTVIKRLFLDRGLWNAVANSVTVSNLTALDAVAARGHPAGSLGEGLADALDVGGL